MKELLGVIASALTMLITAYLLVLLTGNKLVAGYIFLICGWIPAIIVGGALEEFLEKKEYI